MYLWLSPPAVCEKPCSYLCLHLCCACTEPWEACIEAGDASLQPCHCPVWEKHSIRYPTSSDAPFQSQLLQACLPFLSASIQPCHVGGEDQLFSSDQFWLPVEMRKTIPQQDQRWIASTLWRNQRLRPDVQLCKTIVPQLWRNLPVTSQLLYLLS
ncbi:unnamed protein product [Boreogadus saida]